MKHIISLRAVRGIKSIMLKRLLALLTVAVALTALATTPREDIARNPRRAASNHYAYPIGTEVAPPALTPSPAGYEPFYIAHYGRHGSRWLTSDKDVNGALRTLDALAAHHQLTFEGERLHDVIIRIAADSRDRIGDLTDVGAEQHQNIARRMYHNFPEVLSGDARVDARSTTWIRCILSMQNATTTLSRLNPQLRIVTDASYHDMYYMGWGYGEDTLANPIRKQMDLITDSLNRTVDASRFIRQLVRDDVLEQALEHIDAGKFMRHVFNIAGNMQSHHCYDDLSLFDLFTTDEIFELWRLQNIWWYIHWGNAEANGNRLPFIERDLLKDILAKCDEAIATGERGASLRYGHETCVLPLACMMEIDSVNYSTGNLDTLHEHWQNYNIIPKGCNIQMVLYRPVGSTGAISADDVLVKVLFNEHEATLPATAVTGPYYRWSDLSAYYRAKTALPTAW